MEIHVVLSLKSTDRKVHSLNVKPIAGNLYGTLNRLMETCIVSLIKPINLNIKTYEWRFILC